MIARPVSTGRPCARRRPGLSAETGLLIGSFLSGDSPLFTADLLYTTTATGRIHLSLAAVLRAAATGALMGAQTGFWIGQRGGRPRGGVGAAEAAWTRCCAPGFHGAGDRAVRN